MLREVDALRNQSRSMTVDEMEGDATLFAEIKTALLSAAEILVLRFKYLNVVPWNFARADEPEGAQHFLQGVLSRPLDKQDDLTQYLYGVHRRALEERAAGGPCDPSLAEEVSVMNATPLDESAGEGYHRGTHLTRLRAFASKSPYIKQSTRLNQNIGHIKKLLQSGVAGKRVLRYEWRHYSRILQTNPRYQWKRKKMQSVRVFERLYRMDAMAGEDWRSVCTPIHAPGQSAAAETEPEPGESKTQTGLRVEYLHDVLVAGHWYEVETPDAGMDGDGQPVQGTEKKYFNVLSIAKGQSRPKLMPTIESYADPVVIKQMALNIVESSIKPDVVVGEGSVLVYEDSPPRWIPWQELGPWTDVRRTLTRFREAKGVLDHPGCLVLSDAELARPVHPVTDFRCPTLTILKELRRRGWTASSSRVVHDVVNVGRMDGREAIRMKAYYIVLLQLEQCLPLTTNIPSDEVILFYKLLLAGKQVEPGLSARDYLAIQRGEPVPFPEIPDVDDEEVFTN